MGLPRQQYWNELPFHSLGDLPDPGIKSASPALPADSLRMEPELRRKKKGNNLSGNKLSDTLVKCNYMLNVRLFSFHSFVLPIDCVGI